MSKPRYWIEYIFDGDLQGAMRLDSVLQTVARDPELKWHWFRELDSVMIQAPDRRVRGYARRMDGLKLPEPLTVVCSEVVGPDREYQIKRRDGTVVRTGMETPTCGERATWADKRGEFRCPVHTPANVSEHHAAQS